MRLSVNTNQIIVANLDRKLMISYKLFKFDPLRTSPFKKWKLHKENFKMWIHSSYSLPKTCIMRINKGWQNQKITEQCFTFLKSIFFFFLVNSLYNMDLLTNNKYVWILLVQNFTSHRIRIISLLFHIKDISQDFAIASQEYIEN